MDVILRKPVYWGLDPLFHAHVKLLARMLRRMIPGVWGDNDAVYFYRFVAGHPPRPVRLIMVGGIVVFLATHQKFTRFLVDDGTGTIRCMLWAENFGDNLGPCDIMLGDYVQIRAKLEWRNALPVAVVQWHHTTKDPHAELIWWMDVKRTHEREYTRKHTITLTAEIEESLSQSS